MTDQSDQTDDTQAEETPEQSGGHGGYRVPSGPDLLHGFGLFEEQVSATSAEAAAHWDSRIWRNGPVRL